MTFVTNERMGKFVPVGPIAYETITTPKQWKNVFMLAVDKLAFNAHNVHTLLSFQGTLKLKFWFLP